MDLICDENNSFKECKSNFDPVFIEDERVIKNLLSTQSRYTIQFSYFKCVQTNLNVFMREQVANWMLEICEEEKCQEDVFPLAVNIMDRFLSLVPIQKGQLQLLGTVCLFLASKLRQTRQLLAYRLILYTDQSITMDQLAGWELLVLSQLKWDLAAVTPNDFLNLILRRIQTRCVKDKERLMLIKKHAQIFIALCATDFRFSTLPPSVIAAACVGVAIIGLTSVRNRSSNQEIIGQLCKITSTDLGLLIDIQNLIEHVIHKQVSG